MTNEAATLSLLANQPITGATFVLADGQTYEVGERLGDEEWNVLVRIARDNRLVQFAMNKITIMNCIRISAHRDTIVGRRWLNVSGLA